MQARTVELGGEEYTVRLTAAAIGIAHERGISVIIDEQMQRSDIAMGMHLLYIALQTELPREVSKEQVMKWVGERDDQFELCAWMCGQYLDANELVKKSFAPRHQEMIQQRGSEALQQMMKRIQAASGSDATTSTGS